MIVAGPEKKTYPGKNGYPCTPDTTIKDDLENAGAAYLDQSVVVDGNLISSRTPADLPDFCRAIIRSLD